MKKLMLVPLTLICAVLLAGCSDEPKIEFDTIENVKSGISDAFSENYDHITIPEDIKVEIPDSLSIYDPKSEPVIESKDDPKTAQTISLLYDPDDFDKSKNRSDSMLINTLNAESGNPTYQFLNETKDEHAAISRNGYVHLGPDELLSYEVTACEYIDRLDDNETYQKAITAANAKIKEAVEMQGNSEMKPYLFYTVKSSAGNTFYMVYFCKLIDGVPCIPFGTDRPVNMGGPANTDFQLRWIKQSFYVFVDEDFNARCIHIDNKSSSEKAETVENIATLDSVLDYISKTTAANLTIDIRNISLMYASDSVDRKIYPVWYIEYRNRKAQSPDAEEYNRVIINAVNGLVTSYIENNCYVKQG